MGHCVWEPFKPTLFSWIFECGLGIDSISAFSDDNWALPRDFFKQTPNDEVLGTTG